MPVTIPPDFVFSVVLGDSQNGEFSAGLLENWRFRPVRAYRGTQSRKIGEGWFDDVSRETSWDFWAVVGWRHQQALVRAGLPAGAD